MRMVLLAIVAVFVGAGGAQPQDYMLRAGDTVEISVLEDPGLNRQVLVRPDGKISFPLAGTLTAAGRTPEALRDAIRRALSSDFVTPPTVTVSLESLADSDEAITEEDTATIYVIGEVSLPGSYTVPKESSILQALAIAGGPSVFAARDRIQVRRVEGETESMMLFDYESLEDGATPSNRIVLREGDVIVVPERGLFD